ncbi:phage putative head morphogenesis protein, SPP1 gp7 family [Burkholderia vietnamiensis]|uniref:PBECR2 nuclease fold domain-containing protein n=2 Tax=Burkholderiaceae TaxID=119060 RepID=UPI000550E937|nr:PBECR2 nuclease fold domain-containing protein [Burkholderia vietnamiensis]AOJ13161.1 phage head morphogenesis protein [Burkholderia vietnamiensis]TCT31942.1 SPP1 gp7 family putative phage head morphogenesis protein [Burkholderia vietnamiensis]SCZ28194.1 phage putative head morphogenesis protein, SPP1 gp7 family [Burkholderia vietnamiensis]SFX63394.1 phage putative head morphogenesis protein, SPP1 gp7 family [Burkholderia vietnamiensis]HDR9256401.1 minor capsid protein [Burkholderia vietnam
MAGVDLSYAIGLEPAEAVRYFESKGYQLGFRWQDVAAEAHARAFTVAGVMKVDVLQDIRAALTDALKKGTTFEQFKNDLIPTLQKKGWFGRGDVVDGDTGEIQGRRLTPRRLDTIFRTNMQSSYMAGRFATQMAQVDTRPWWEYVAILDNRTRPSHAALHGSVFRYDDPFWSVFYPPCGYRCRCRVRTRPFGYRDAENPPTSAGRLETVEQPVGRDGKTQPATAYRSPITGKLVLPDPGFGFNPGREWLRPFTPPPLDNLPRTFPSGVELPDLPVPTRVPASSLLPAGREPQQYAKAFLQEFDLQLGQAKVFEDATRTPVAISDDLFKASDGTWKADKDGRGAYMGLLARAIQSPDEIWLRWEESRDQPGKWLLKRRYIKSWEIDGQDGAQYGLSVFEFGQDGWSGSTAMMANTDRSEAARRRYIERQREGFLAYRK